MRGFFILVLIYRTVNLNAQVQFSEPIAKKNIVFVESFGNAIVFTSLNYERVFKQWDKLYFSNTTCLGYDIFRVISYSRSYNFSNMFNASWRIGPNSSIEFGAGLAYNKLAGSRSYTFNGVTTLRPFDEKRVLLPLGFQYKFLQPNGGVYFKIGITPKGYIYDSQEPCPENSFFGCWKNFDLFMQSVGASIGYSF